jgi:hypothetical protein
MHLAMEKYEDVYGTEHPDPAHRLEADAASVGHTFLHFPVSPDGGSEANRDPSGRAARFLREAEDGEVGVIALDFILGEGAEPDPVGTMLPAIHEAKERAAREGRHLEVLGYVLGTDLDTPSLSDQVHKLEAAGVTIASSSANTGLLSREFVWKN